jgi:hypothetical protein
MGCALRLDGRGGQFAMLLIATRQLLGVEQCRDAGATWQGLIFPAGIHSQFRQQGSRPPPWMCPTQVQDGITHFRRPSAQRSAAGAAHVRVEARTPLVLPTAAPCAYRPDRATERSCNLWVGLSSGGPFGDV